jgi:hypothetical protein
MFVLGALRISGKNTMEKTLKILFVEDSEVQQELGVYRLQDLGFNNVIGALTCPVKLYHFLS